MLDFHIEKKSDITVVCKDMMYNDDVSRFGVVRMDDESRITEFDEKPIEAHPTPFPQVSMSSGDDSS